MKTLEMRLRENRIKIFEFKKKIRKLLIKSKIKMLEEAEDDFFKHISIQIPRATENDYGEFLYKQTWNSEELEISKILEEVIDFLNEIGDSKTAEELADEGLILSEEMYQIYREQREKEEKEYQNSLLRKTKDLLKERVIEYPLKTSKEISETIFRFSTRQKNLLDEIAIESKWQKGNWDWKRKMKTDKIKIIYKHKERDIDRYDTLESLIKYGIERLEYMKRLQILFDNGKEKFILEAETESGKTLSIFDFETGKYIKEMRTSKFIKDYL